MSKEPGCPFGLTVLLPTLIWGPMIPGQPHLNTSASALVGYVDGSIQEIENACKTVVDVRDVAKAHVEAIRRDVAGRRFLLIGGSPHFKEVANYIRDALPEDMKAKVPTKVSEKLGPTVLGPPPPLSVAYDVAPTEKLLGIHFTPVREQVRSMVQTMLENGFSSAEQYVPDRNRTRQELVSARSETADLARRLSNRRWRMTLHLESGWDVLRKHHERWLLSVAFHAFGAARQVVWRRTPDSRDDRTSRGRVAAWQWLWRKKVVSLWRRATGLSQRDRLREDQEAQLGHHRSSIWELQECVERLHGRRVDINSLLQSERARVQELESELGSCQGQVKELQRTLKELLRAAVSGLPRA
ncbi:unnamed protein product [Effrenium voratum]|uniref:Uncharacterized protein n=1 Tax=Effrenium voratum TaxID=2562239 RepID=A0AA36N3K2_9DINO|nr:unnamed protein product [Effrenium voratum]